MNLDKVGRTFLFVVAAAALIIGGRMAGQMLVPYLKRAHSGAGNLLEKIVT